MKNREILGNLRQTQRNPQKSQHEDPDEERAFHPPDEQHDEQRQPEKSQCRLRGSQTSGGNKRFRAGNDNSGTLQADERNEKTDPRGDGFFQEQGNRIDDGFADVENGHQQKHNSLTENSGESQLIRIAHFYADGVGEKSVQPHGRRQRDREVGQQPHDQHGKNRRQHGCGEHTSRRHARLAQNQRIDRQNVGHCHKRRHSGQTFRADRSPAFTELEKIYFHSFTSLRRIAIFILCIFGNSSYFPPDSLKVYKNEKNTAPLPL